MDKVLCFLNKVVVLPEDWDYEYIEDLIDKLHWEFDKNPGMEETFYMLQEKALEVEEAEEEDLKDGLREIF
jgi:hypothetical protein